VQVAGGGGGGGRGSGAGTSGTEVQVGGRWAKAEIGDFNVQYGERRKVKRGVAVRGWTGCGVCPLWGGAMQPPPEPEPEARDCTHCRGASG
jgi:hypothetical protein